MDYTIFYLNLAPIKGIAYFKYLGLEHASDILQIVTNLWILL